MRYKFIYQRRVTIEKFYNRFGWVAPFLGATLAEVKD